jgi:hypothetical protein
VVDAEQGKTVSELSQQLVSRMMKNIVAQRDEVIIGALTKVLGKFNIESLRGRLTNVTYGHDQREEWLLDGVVLCEFYPLETDIRGATYYASQNYRVFAKQSSA